MSFKGLITFFFFLAIFGYISYFIYHKFFVPPQKKLYKTEYPKKRNIYQIIHATGTLEIKDHIKIGSLVGGTIKDIYVEENEYVKKGQLLTEIDNGKSDTDVKEKEGEVEYVQAELDYERNYYNRQKQLFESGQISTDFFEKVTSDYKKLEANLKSKKAELEKAKIEFNNTKILAPVEGIIVNIGITKGMRITTDLDATVLFVIAKDITKMEAVLDIDESDIGQIQKGQKVTFTVGTYLDKYFKGTIIDVSYSPQYKNNILSYKAFVHISDPENFLRPGMTINAKINVAKSISCLAISSLAFQVNSEILKKIAKKINFTFTPIDKKSKKNLTRNNSENYSIKYVWVVENNNFIEKAIKVGITDDSYFEIINGINASNKIIVDIEEYDDMENLYKSIFKSAI